MAQVELRFFSSDLLGKDRREIAEFVAPLVFDTHYPHLLREVGDNGEPILEDGDITLVVPVLDTAFSSSDADFEIEISEGSDSWPRNEDGLYLPEPEMAKALRKRASRISEAISGCFPDDSHNIFEVNGVATGWCQYKAVE